MEGTVRNRTRWANVTRGLARIVGAVAAVLVVCAPARAFYWYDWPGSRIRVQETLVNPPNTPGNPPVVQPPVIPQPPGSGHVPTPPVGPPVPVDQPPVGPTHTPEPSTALLGALGLSAVAAVRRWRSRK